MSVIKKILKSVAPQLFRRAKNIHKQNQFRRGHNGSEYRAKVALTKQFGQKVLSGPFQGMPYGDNALCSAYVAKLVGSYEEELHDIVQQIIEKRYSTVIDIGCAEGYYAVGLAVQMPDAQVYAFDVDEEAQHYCTELAQRNKVADRVKVRGLCDHATLQKLCTPQTIVICDCEGCESHLLDPARAPALKQCDMLVELHEFMEAGLTNQLLERFKETHNCDLIDTTERDPSAYAVLSHVLPGDRYLAVREGREASMQWAHLVQKSAS